MPQLLFAHSGTSKLITRTGGTSTNAYLSTADLSTTNYTQLTGGRIGGLSFLGSTVFTNGVGTDGVSIYTDGSATYVEATKDSVTSTLNLTVMYTNISNCVHKPNWGQKYQTTESSLYFTYDVYAALNVRASQETMWGFYVNGSPIWHGKLNDPGVLQYSPWFYIPAYTSFNRGLFEPTTATIYEAYFVIAPVI